MSDHDLDVMMVDSIVVYPVTGINFNSQSIWSTTPKAFKGRLNGSTQMVRNAAGELVTSTLSFVIQGDPGLDLRDKIVLPDGTSRPIIQITKHTDPEARGSSGSGGGGFIFRSVGGGSALRAAAEAIPLGDTLSSLTHHVTVFLE